MIFTSKFGIMLPTKLPIRAAYEFHWYTNHAVDMV